MKSIVFSSLLIFFFAFNAEAKRVRHPKIHNLKGAMILVKNDDQQERFSMEANIGKIFSVFKMPILLSINLIKEGAPLTDLADQKIQSELNAKNINSVLVISVRGFDTRFKPRTKIPPTLAEMLQEGNLNKISYEESASVTLEFFQYINGKFNGYQMLRLGGASDRAKVYNRLQKKLNKLVPKWQV